MVKYHKITYLFSGTLVAVGLFAIFYFGFNLGIDFTGGSLLEVEFTGSVPSPNELSNAFAGFETGDLKIQKTGDRGYLLRFREVNEETHQKIIANLNSLSPQGAVEKRFDSIGPTIGKELQKRALTAVLLTAIMIILYIAFAFRKVSASKVLKNKNLSSFKYGIIAVIALLHDIIIPSGVFAVLGHFKGVEIDSLFVTAILTILGFSVHDTIVVFDRIRENLLKNPSQKFEDTVNKSVKETIIRSINTSLTVLLVLIALFIFGGETTQYFSLALILGVFFGTYSSIFLASPLLVTWLNLSNRKPAKN